MKFNFAYQLIYQILTIIIPFITTPYVSRVLGAEGVGIYSYTNAVVTYFVLFGRLGIQMYGNRLIAMQNGDKNKVSMHFWNLFMVHLIFSGISIIAYYIFVMNIQEHKIIFAIQGIQLIAQLLDINWLFFGLEKFKITITRNIIIKLLTLISIFLFVKTSGDIWKYIFILAFGTALSECMLWIAVPQYINWHKPVIKEMKTHIKPVIKLFVPVIASSIYTMIDKLFIKYYCEIRQVGYYENAEKVVSVGRLVTVALGTVALPHASKLVVEKRESDLQKLIYKSLKVDVWFAVGFIYGIVGIAQTFIPAFMGEEFEPSVHIIYALAPCVLCWPIANIFRTQYVIPKQMDNIYVNSQIIAAIINVICNMLFIPYLGTIGAAIGTVAAESMVCEIMIAASREIVSLKKCFLGFVKMNILGIVMYIIIKLIGNLNMSVWMCTVTQVMLGGAVYLILSIFIDKYSRRK